MLSEYTVHRFHSGKPICAWSQSQCAECSLNDCDALPMETTRLWRFLSALVSTQKNDSGCMDGGNALHDSKIYRYRSGSVRRMKESKDRRETSLLPTELFRCHYQYTHPFKWTIEYVHLTLAVRWNEMNEWCIAHKQTQDFSIFRMYGDDLLWPMQRVMNHD